MKFTSFYFVYEYYYLLLDSIKLRKIPKSKNRTIFQRWELFFFFNKNRYIEIPNRNIIQRNYLFRKGNAFIHYVFIRPNYLNAKKKRVLKLSFFTCKYSNDENGRNNDIVCIVTYMLP